MKETSWKRAGFRAFQWAPELVLPVNRYLLDRDFYTARSATTNQALLSRNLEDQSAFIECYGPSGHEFSRGCFQHIVAIAGGSRSGFPRCPGLRAQCAWKPGASQTGFSDGDSVWAGPSSRAGACSRAGVFPYGFASVRRPALHGQCPGTARRSLHAPALRRTRRNSYRACADQSRVCAHLARGGWLPAGQTGTGVEVGG